MLIKDFYKIIDFSFSKNQVLAQIRLNPDHKIYDGHFPNQAVVPGVVQLQIIKEMMEKAGNQKLMLTEMAFSKFLNMIIPKNTPILKLEIKFSLQGSLFNFSAIVKYEELVFTKVKGIFTVASH